MHPTQGEIEFKVKSMLHVFLVTMIIHCGKRMPQCNNRTRPNGTFQTKINHCKGVKEGASMISPSKCTWVLHYLNSAQGWAVCVTFISISAPIKLNPGRSYFLGTVNHGAIFWE